MFDHYQKKKEEEIPRIFWVTWKFNGTWINESFWFFWGEEKATASTRMKPIQTTKLLNATQNGRMKEKICEWSTLLLEVSSDLFHDNV